MNELKFFVTKGEPDSQDYQVLTEGMLAYHASKGHPRTPEKFSIFLKDEQQKVFGAIVVTFLWNGMEIQSLWVDDSLRGQGWGRKLLEAAEAEGVKRGCAFAYTNTFTWQAPGFYEKMGYVLYGRLENFPEGNALSYYRKEL